jgi:hypothetical protein
LSTGKRRFFERCLPCRANDVCFAYDVAFGNDVCLRAHRANIASLRHEVTQHHLGASRYIISR